MRRAARETIRDRPRGLEREARLPHASRAHQRDESHAGAHQQLADLRELAVPADRLVRRRRQPRSDPTAGRSGRQLGVVREDHALHPPQLRPRLDAELVHQQPAARAHRLERLRLPAGSVQRQHQLRAQALAERVLGDQRAQLADQVRVAPACQVSREPLLDRLHPQLLQAGDLVLRELVETMIRQCLPSPQCQRFAQIGRGAATARFDRARPVRGRGAARNGGSRSPRGRSRGRSPPADGAAAILHPGAGADARPACAAHGRRSREPRHPIAPRAARRWRRPRARGAPAARRACVA